MGDKKTNPTLAETVFDTGLQLATTGKTKTHDPIGDYIREDPLRAFLQFPAEAALWVSSGKALGVAGSVLKKASPIKYETKAFLSDKGKSDTVIKAITVNNRPIISSQGGKIGLGMDVEKLPFSKIPVATRSGYEASLGSGFEKNLFYTRSSLKNQVSRGVIDETSAKRASAFVDAVMMSRKISNKGQPIGKAPIEGLTTGQSKHILDLVTKGQKSGEVDLIHGSVATKSSIPTSLQKQAGSGLAIGDIDVVLAKNLKSPTDAADKLINKFRTNFPLEEGQRLEMRGVGKGATTNRSLELSGGTLKEPKKILEVVLKESDQGKVGEREGTHILGVRIPFDKSIKPLDWNIKTHVADYQLLTNVKQALAYQKGTDALFQIYPSSGRTKDIVRSYWNLKAKAVFKGGTAGNALDRQAEYIRSLYPKIEFTDVKEKATIFSSSLSRTSSKNNPLLGGTSRIPFKTDTSAKSEKPESIFSEKPESIFSERPPSMFARNPSSISNVPRTSSRVHMSGSEMSRNTRMSVRDSVKIPRSSNITSQGRHSSYRTPRIFDKPSGRIPSIFDTPSTKPSKPESVFDTPSNIFTRNTVNIRSSADNPFYNHRKNRVLLPPIINWKTKSDKRIKEKRKRRDDFLGNTNVEAIDGFRTKESDIVYGEKKTRKLEYENILFTRKNHKKNVSNPFGNGKKSSGSKKKKSGFSFF